MEIVVQCRKCGEKLDYYRTLDRSDTLLIEPALCPVCHPVEPEKVAPGDNVWIEVKEIAYDPDCFARRKSAGRRNRFGKVLASPGIGIGASSWDQWRYPGEVEWRD